MHRTPRRIADYDAMMDPIRAFGAISFSTICGTKDGLADIVT